ncbi:cytochrome c biogenesis protein CcsA [Zavarzinella formosa]|uniref:cytochrome c biogenesis protein CcsA n=1 Tax=Zavarzinella formosa TaxID=360055 RepID=UPI000310FAE1|nr:cytochrome c biogenesis protein CcsA [Zavarzinella formosa]
MGITHLCFGLSYLTAFVLEIAHQYRPSEVVRWIGTGFGLAGLVAHTFYLLYHHPSPASGSGSLLILGWVLAVFYLYGALHRTGRPLTLFVLPLVIGMSFLSYAYLGDDPDVNVWFNAEHFWGTLHGLLLLAACVGITLGFLGSVMYLIQLRRLKKKQSLLGGFRMLSLERLETMNRRAINWAFPFLTVGLLLGWIRWPGSEMVVAPGSWTAAKILGSVGLWAVALVLLYLRYGTGLAARRLAYLTMFAFALMLVTLMTSHPFAAAGEVAK